MSESSAGVVQRYLQDAIAAERSFEAQLDAYAAAVPQNDSRNVLKRCAAVCENHRERLTRRLEALGGAASVSKGFLSSLFALAPKHPNVEAGHEDRVQQDLVTAFAVANSQLALYEAAATMAEAASDPETASLLRSLQTEHRSLAQDIWAMLSTVYPSAMSARNLP